MNLASPLRVVLINQSTVVRDADVSNTAAALDVQLNRDFAPYWGIDGHVTAAKTVQAGQMPVYILDDSDQAGALGYHDDDPSTGPYGRVFAKTDQRYGLNWTITTSHEVLELAADPFVFSGVQINGTQWTALEVCDAVESDTDGYKIGDCWVSDFVTPAWFGMGSGAYDYRKLLRRPFSLRRGGYMSVWTAGTGWTQKTARPVPGHTSRAEFAHRRLRKAQAQEARHAQLVEDDDG